MSSRGMKSGTGYEEIEHSPYYNSTFQNDTNVPESILRTIKISRKPEDQLPAFRKQDSTNGLNVVFFAQNLKKNIVRTLNLK